MGERGGEVLTRVIPNRRRNSVVPHILTFVKPGTKVATDTAKAFINLHDEGFQQGTVNHAAGEYVRGPVYTNTIEPFWAILKLGIQGTHIWVSEKHLPLYLAEFEFRFNLQRDPHLMFDLLLQALPVPTASR